MRIKKDKNFISLFDDETGKYMRTGIIADSKDTGADPFMASFPELLDVGIMGHCIHGRSGRCLRTGVECYQGGNTADAPNMSLEDFRYIAEQCRGKTFQFALGGCGDPDQHENFREILEICREMDIVPNFTTSGFGMDEAKARICAEYCGAVAVSWYRTDYTDNAVRLLLDAGVKTNIHFVLNRHTVNEAVLCLQDNSFPDGINAVVFLLHKPVGLGTQGNVLTLDDVDLRELLRLVNEPTESRSFKIGFDSCTIPALVNNPGILDPDSVDTCEGARWSAYITPDMKMLPCSFDQSRRWQVDLRTNNVQEAWDSPKFEEFRDILRTACPDCESRQMCMGGCPICPEIVLCERKDRSHTTAGNRISESA